MDKKNSKQNKFIEQLKGKNLIEKVKFICSITVKNDGKALDVIFVLCLISIIAFSIFLYLSSTNFYNRLDETMQNNISLNFEAVQNEQIDRIQNLLDIVSQKEDQNIS